MPSPTDSRGAECGGTPELPAPLVVPSTVVLAGSLLSTGGIVCKCGAEPRRRMLRGGARRTLVVATCGDSAQRHVSNLSPLPEYTVE